MVLMMLVAVGFVVVAAEYYERNWAKGGGFDVTFLFH